MTLRCMAMVAAVIAAGCAGPQEPHSGDVPPGLNDAPRTAIESCSSAQAALVGAEPADRYGLAAEGCAELFSLPLCREAVRMSPQAAPELRPAMISVACQRAYCELLPEPAPALCALSPATVPSSELVAPWRAFVSAVLGLELGLEPGSELHTLLILGVGVLVQAPVVVAEVVETPATEAAAAPERHLVVRLSMDGSGFSLAATVGDEDFGPWELPLPPDVGDFSGMLEAAMRAAGSSPRVHIEIGAEVTYAVVLRLMDALREAQVDEITVSPWED